MLISRDMNAVSDLRGKQGGQAVTDRCAMNDGAETNPATPAEDDAHLYADGHPHDDVHYIEAKIILDGMRFTSLASFGEFAQIVARVAKRLDVEFDRHSAKGQRPKIREVLFLDTQDFKLYNNAYILRRRITYEDGFPVGDPEMVFKFRHPDRQTATALDVRPRIHGNYRIKFKEEVLPLKDRLGGVRSLYSHNVQFPLRTYGLVDPTAQATIIRVFPLLGDILANSHEHVKLVNRTAVEEVLLDLGTLDFGKGFVAPCNIAVWRTRGDQMQLVGEFAYQLRFDNREALNPKAVQRHLDFFRALQMEAQDWMSLGTTKTGAVYRLKGNPPQSHE